MALRPWLRPEDVKAYTDYQSVRDRRNYKLAVDISRAEEYVIKYTNNRFDDGDTYPVIPTSVKTAVLLLAEAYANNAVEATKDMKSETFDDYSYTREGKNIIDIPSLGLESLLDEYIAPSGSSGVNMKLRKL